MKKVANRHVRRIASNTDNDIGNYRYYKRMFCTYDIYDYRSYYPLSEYEHRYRTFYSTLALSNSLFAYRYIYRYMLTRNGYMKSYYWK